MQASAADTLFSHGVFNALTWTFVAALAAVDRHPAVARARQVRHVARTATRARRPSREAIPLAAHQKAADYTVAKTRIGMLDLLISTLALLVLTLGGLIDRLQSLQWAQALDPGGLWHGVALIGSVVLLLALIELPLSVYRTFVVEQRYGFNRMTPKLFVIDLAKQALLAAALVRISLISERSIVPHCTFVLRRYGRNSPWFFAASSILPSRQSAIEPSACAVQPSGRSLTVRLRRRRAASGARASRQLLPEARRSRR